MPPTLGSTHLYTTLGLPTVTLTRNWLANALTAALTTTLGTAVVLLRLLNATLRGRPTGKDDVAMYAAYTASVHYTVGSVVALRWGVGLRKEEVPAAWVVQAMKVTFAVEIFYFVAVFAVKVSVLCMYLRLCEGLGREHLLARGTVWMLGLLTLHFVTTIVVASVQCVPMDRFWLSGTDLGDGHCINIIAFFYSTNVFTIVTDLVILALPVSTFWSMQMQRREKVGVIAIFGVGLISTAASCARLYSIDKFIGTEKGLENAALINTWSFVEIYLGIFCASVPAIKTFFTGSRSARRRWGRSRPPSPTPVVSAHPMSSGITGNTSSTAPLHRP